MTWEETLAEQEAYKLARSTDPDRELFRAGEIVELVSSGEAVEVEQEFANIGEVAIMTSDGPLMVPNGWLRRI